MGFIKQQKCEAAHQQTAHKENDPRTSAHRCAGLAIMTTENGGWHDASASVKQQPKSDKQEEIFHPAILYPTSMSRAEGSENGRKGTGGIHRQNWAVRAPWRLCAVSLPCDGLETARPRHKVTD
jgi:hypothetical protein